MIMTLPAIKRAINIVKGSLNLLGITNPPRERVAMIEARGLVCASCPNITESIMGDSCAKCGCLIDSKITVTDELCPIYNWGFIKIGKDAVKLSKVAGRLAKGKYLHVRVSGYGEHKFVGEVTRIAAAYGLFLKDPSVSLPALGGSPNQVVSSLYSDWQRYSDLKFNLASGECFVPVGHIESIEIIPFLKF